MSISNSIPPQNKAAPDTPTCRWNDHPGFLLLQFLALELGQPLVHLAPGLRAVDQLHESLQDLVLGGPDLVRRVTVTKRDSVILERLEVDRDAERRAELVVS